ncbi:MAG: hypothetical protein JO093_14870 [Acidobacteria bacterium]|nr:hypothetical protein [Acidobacteriota bacterium]MBV9186896.1 hypothetical protein [Acidobacteriota bacterium]
MRTVNWCLWKALIPALMVFGLWPFYAFVATMEHPFQRAFAPGDFILFSAILLFEIGAEADGGGLFPRGIRIGSALTRALAALLMPIYWVIRHDVMLKEDALACGKSPSPAYSALLHKLRNYGCFSCTVAVISLIIAALLAIALLEYHRTEELRELGMTI